MSNIQNRYDSRTKIIPLVTEQMDWKRWESTKKCLDPLETQEWIGILSVLGTSKSKVTFVSNVSFKNNKECNHVERVSVYDGLLFGSQKLIMGKICAKRKKKWKI